MSSGATAVTLVSELIVFRFGVVSRLGLGTTRHAVPSQCSISVAVKALPSVAYEPTAHASVADSTVTALRLLRRLLAFGLDTTPKPQPAVVTVASAVAVSEAPTTATIAATPRNRPKDLMSSLPSR
jgi:hypothetical protein